MTLVQEFMGTLPGWITAVTSTGAAGTAGSIWLRSRRVRIAERQNDRAGYGDVIAILRQEVTRLAVECHDSSEKHKDCEKRLTLLEAELRGVHRQMITNSLTAAVQVGSLSPEMQRAVEVLTRKLGDQEPSK